ncbi:cytochrome c3 family protein [Seleniivibrio woodruffii]|uniref:cytochrome c3 family protein n=1 Tax=Seleniivibrio woodruffii TaxID=1078050 RepID=UPI0039E45EE3
MNRSVLLKPAMGVLAAFAVLLLAPALHAAVIKGTVKDVSGQAVGKASVYLIPASDVEAMAQTPTIIKKDSPNDEPLEDNLAANKDKYKSAVTDAKGAFVIKNAADEKYFVYVVPADSAYLPGGDKANKSLTPASLKGKPLNILLSGNTPEGAQYTGSSKCLTCHKEYMSVKKTLHKLGIKKAGQVSGLQDMSDFPEYDKGLNFLKKGQKVYFYAYNKDRSWDKYLASVKEPKDPASVSFTAYFYTAQDGTVKVKMENMKNTADPAREYTVEMTYGGGLYKQRYLLRIGKNMFPFLQFNPNGDDAYGDRTRMQFRDYHGDWFYDEANLKLKDAPLAKSFEKECASCHYNGYGLKKLESGEYIAEAANDPKGEADIDGDGIHNELNLGCETCHGPGSAHVKAPKAKKASTIVSPAKLSAERATVICGQCHSRPQGNLNNDQPVDKNNRMMLPGTSRNNYLLNNTTREDAAKNDFWADGLHSKSHHQQYTDFIKSAKYRNGDILVTCTSCHAPHGGTKFAHQLKADAVTPKATLCQSCHKDVKDIEKHTEKTVGMAHGKDTEITCTSCHSVKTAQTGAGFGRGQQTADGKNYWQNDITTHLFSKPPRKGHAGVFGVEAGKSMPTPYTGSCGKCHDVNAK